MNDLINRQDAIDAINKIAPVDTEYDCKLLDRIDVRYVLIELPSAQPEQRYTEEELRVFAHGISLSLLSKRSSQRWRYDKDTATEIKFLERLYDKVSADMKGGQG